ncbi:NarL family two-component system response regulator [Sphingobium sp. SYK-6]|uniref:response regulator transcription factor n=1 Tax=Sphingobium sp. (strain NBRC 103272 / SYK-6) TaxID=627192 RepID=UPI00022766F4|nr:response regulator [Sphingobium sp. SYK-6]BAK65749.1 NarL family two-component system response regulator [Sphingobium sp. SYK-6]
MPEPRSATVHIVEDDGGLADGLVRLVRSVGYEARAYGTVSAFLDIALDTGPSAGPACILLDVRLPDMSGLDLQDRLRTPAASAPIIMMTGYGDIPMSVRAMKAGAIDFLMKPFREQDLLDAIGRAVERDRALLAERATQAVASKRMASLTSREAQLFHCVVEGLMNREIAERLDLSIVTVKAHRGAMMRKMEARSVADLVRVAGLLNGGMQ